MNWRTFLKKSTFSVLIIEVIAASIAFQPWDNLDGITPWQLLAIGQLLAAGSVLIVFVQKKTEPEHDLTTDVYAKNAKIDFPKYTPAKHAPAPHRWLDDPNKDIPEQKTPPQE